MHLRIRLRAHLSACQRKMNQGRLHPGSAEPQGWLNLDRSPSRCISRRSSPYTTTTKSSTPSLEDVPLHSNGETHPRLVHRIGKGRGRGREGVAQRSAEFLDTLLQNMYIYGCWLPSI